MLHHESVRFEHKPGDVRNSMRRHHADAECKDSAVVIHVLETFALVRTLDQVPEDVFESDGSGIHRAKITSAES